MSRAPNKDQVELMRKRGYLTVDEAAEVSKQNKWSLYRWIRNNKVASEKVANNIYVSLKSLAKHIGPIQCEALGLEYPKEDEDTPRRDTFIE